MSHLSEYIKIYVSHVDMEFCATWNPAVYSCAACDLQEELEK